MRRSTGIQALECHLLLTRLPNEAKSIVDAINGVCNRFKSNQNKTTNVFQYSPYTSFSNSEAKSTTTQQQQQQTQQTNSQTEENKSEQNKWSVVASTPPIPVRSKIKTTLNPAKSLLPPKSPLNQLHSTQKQFTKQEDQNKTEINTNRTSNTYVESSPSNAGSRENENKKNDMKSKSVTSLPNKSGGASTPTSIFSKFKFAKNKATPSAVESPESPKMPKPGLKTTADKKHQSKKDKPSMQSASSVGFDEAKSNLKNTPKKKILKNPTGQAWVIQKSNSN